VSDRGTLGGLSVVWGADQTALEEYLTAYLDGAGLRGDPKGALFCTIGRGTGQLTRTVLPQANAYAMIRRRAAVAGIAAKLGNHSFRATGITAYLKNGGTREKAAAMANHAATRTTQLYDRRRDELSLDEVERIVICGLPQPRRAPERGRCSAACSGCRRRY
jgi:integrase